MKSSVEVDQPNNATVSVRLGEISDFITKGATPTTYGYEWQDSGVRFLRSECVSPKGLDLRQAMFISEEAHRALGRSQVVDGDLLMTITGNVGRVVRLRGVGRANINQHIARIRVHDAAFDSEYVYHYLSQPEIRSFYESITTGQAYPQISLVQVRNTFVSGPAFLAQRRIATALSDADDFIATLERLIAKKQAIKQGMMQQLLTGKTRLPGFNREWEEIRLGEVLRFQVGFPFGSSGFSDQPHGPRLVRNRDLRADDTIVYFTGAYSTDYVINNGDVLVGMDGDFALCLWNRGIALLNQRVGRLLVHQAAADASFLSYALAAPLKAIEEGTGATTVKHLSHRDVEEISLRIPEPSEQRAIGLILRDVDAELAALRRRRVAAEDIKRGMMQELLTGRTRLPVARSVA